MHTRRVLLSAVVLFLVCSFAATLHAEQWVFLGDAHVDGQRDHDVIQVGKDKGRFHAIQLRVRQAPIHFERVVVHYGNGTEEVLQIRQFIRAGDQTRAIRLAGNERFIHSLELWYGKADPGSRRPEVKLWAMR